ncbi:MAG TPA: bifunctional oligoribonuclease/PAP phosphatase NrnA [Chloroflexota bacterium]|nr:bifunctional oligoribonuclease/PAP phosphatase NrnA [Chloroflexota bacterium]
MSQVTTSNDLRTAADLIRSADRIAVLSHVNPDADAIGSVLALTRGLQAIGKHAVGLLSDLVPEYAGFLDGAADIEHSLPDGVDLYAFVDAAGIDRVGALYSDRPERFEGARILNLDHHRTNPCFGSVNVVDPAASSTAEIVFHLLQSMQAPIDRGIADALLFGVVGDTGSFRNGATTPGSMETAAELLRLGADTQMVAHQLFERKTFAAARLYGRIMSTIELDRERRIVFGYMSQAMLAEEGATADEAEGVAEEMRGIVEAEVVILLKETPSGEMRVSMRSRPAIDVAQICTALGGGGHRQAAGCTLPAPMEEARATLVRTFDSFYPR